MSSGPLPFPPQTQADIPQLAQPPSQGEPYQQPVSIITAEKAHSHKAYKIIITILLVAVILLGVVVATNNTPALRTASTHPDSYSVSESRATPNWSGFAACCTPTLVSDVIGSWTVPAVTCSSQYSSERMAYVWVGIDGAGRNASSTIEQIGTSSGCNAGNTTPVYFGWYEWYPALPRRLPSPYPVIPGDRVTAEVKWDGSQFIASIIDQSEHWSVQRTNSTIARMASRASAEWIVEAPENLTTSSIVPLANFDKVFFEGCSVTIGQDSGPIGQFSLTQYTMVDSNSYLKAGPMLPFYNDGTSFSVWWLSSGP